MLYNHTLSKTITIQGIGLHSGVLSTLSLKPSSQGFISFHVSTEPKRALAIAPELVNNTSFCTEITKDSFSLKTIEHFMAALSALGLNSLQVEVSGPEVPALDGASFIFMTELKEYVKSLSTPQKLIHITQPFEFKLRDSTVYFVPFSEDEYNEARSLNAPTLYEIQIDFPSPLIGKQSLRYWHTPFNFYEQLSKARTFAYAELFEQLKAQNLARGASLDNAILIDSDHKVVNPSGLHCKDEFVRHKLLDAIGDLYLCNHQFFGKISLHRPGHTVNNQALKSFLQNAESWSLSETYFNSADKKS